MRSSAISVLALAFGLVLVDSGPAAAGPGDWRVLGSAQTWVGGPTTPDDVARALKSDLSSVFRKYRPQGSGISDYKVEGHGYWSRVSFKAEKEVAPLVTKSATIVGVAQTPTRSKSCRADNVGNFYLELNLGGSSSVILDNAWAYGLDICMYYQNGGPNFFITAKIWSKEGGDYGGKAGKATDSLLKAQAWPMIEAMSLRAQDYARQRTAMGNAAPARAGEQRWAVRPDGDQPARAVY